MKLIKFDATNASGFRSGESTIRFASAGQISLSKHFVQKSGLGEGDTVSVAQDEDNPHDWYLLQDENGFALRKCSSEGLAFNNAYIVNSLIDHLNLKTKSIAFKISSESLDVDEEEIGGGQNMGHYHEQCKIC